MIHTFMFQKHIHIVKFYPSADDFTQAPIVMLVTNIMSGLCVFSKILSHPSWAYTFLQLPYYVLQPWLTVNVSQLVPSFGSGPKLCRNPSQNVI